MRARKFLCYILVSIALLVGLLAMPSSSNIEYLPELEFINPYEVRENVSTLIIDKVNDIRALHGLTPVNLSTVLNDSARYKALYVSQYPDNINDSVFVSGPLKDKGLQDTYAYVENEEILYLSNGRYTPDESLATYFSKTLENSFSGGRILLNPNVKSLGVSITYFETIDGSYTVCVLHASREETLPSEISVVPPNIVKRDNTPPEVEVQDVYIAKDFELTDNKILSNIKYSDNGSNNCTVTYDLKGIDTSKIGVYDLNITVSDPGGNITTAVQKIHVVPHVYPLISEEEIIIPNITFNDVYDISKYVQVKDNYGIEVISTEPKFAVKEDDGKEVKVTVINKAGLSIEETLKIKFADLTYFTSPTVKVNSIYPRVGEPLSIEMIKSAIISKDELASIEVNVDSFNAINLDVPGIYYCLASVRSFVDNTYIQTPVAVPVHIVESEFNVASRNTETFQKDAVEISYSKLNKNAIVQEGAHIILEASVDYEGDVTYAYGFSKYGEPMYTITRKSNSLLWYPESTGLYEVKVSAIDTNMNAVVGTSTMNLYISERTIESTKTPYLELKPSSELVTDSVNKTITNIEPKTNVETFIDNFTISDEGVSDLGIRVTDINNNVLTSDRYVGTGTVIELYKEETVYEKFTVILYGDVGGDGRISSSDILDIRYHMLGRIELEGIRFIAANIDNSDNRNVVNSLDLLCMRYYLLGRQDINQNRK